MKEKVYEGRLRNWRNDERNKEGKENNELGKYKVECSRRRG